MEVDDLFPVSMRRDAGFCQVLAEGDMEITAKAASLGKRILKRRGALSRSCCQECLHPAAYRERLHTKSRPRDPGGIVSRHSGQHFSSGEVQRQFDTVLHWGRYGEIFDYDSDSGRLFLPGSPQNPDSLAAFPKIMITTPPPHPVSILVWRPWSILPWGGWSPADRRFHFCRGNSSPLRNRGAGAQSWLGPLHATG